MHETPATETRVPPGDPLWLIIQRLDDVRREQDRLRQEMGELRQELRAEIAQLRQHVDQRFDRLTGWFITGLVAILAAVISVGFATR